MNPTIHPKKSFFENAFGNACRLALQKKILLTAILLTNVLIAAFSQKASGLLSSYDSCYVRPPQQQTSFAIGALSVGAPMVRVAYVIPSNRAPQPNGVANLQHAIKAGRQFFKEQMEQNGFGPKTYVFETEADGVTPLINVVHVTETDEYLREDIWGRTQTAAINAGISLWAQGEVWVVIPETHLMFPDGSGAGGVALGAGVGSGNGGGVSMIGSNALPLFNPAMITDDTPYDGKVLPELGPYPMKQDVTFAWFEGTTFSSVASSWLGALWHETGHAFGLGHDFRNDNNFHGNLMGNGLRGTRGSLFPEKYPQDYTRLEYWTALFLNVSHFFNSDKTGTSGPTLSHPDPTSVTPQQGLVHVSFQASDPDGLSFAYLTYGGDMAAEILLDGTTADTTFAVPYFKQGDINRYTIFVLDKQGNKTAADVQFNVPGGNNQAPIPFIRIDPPVPGLNQPVVLNATQSNDVDHDQSSILATWDVDNDGQFDTEPSTNKTVQYLYENPGNYLIRLKLTDPAGAQTISTAVSVKIPGEKKITVESFTLIDADKDEAVAELQNGLVIDPSSLEGKTFSIRANTSPGMIERVEFNLEGPIVHHQVDSEPPYSLFGDSDGNYIGRPLLPGEYTLTATPFSASEVGVALAVSFRINSSSIITSDKTIGGLNTDELTSVIATSDGGYLLAGHSSSNVSGDKSENARGIFDYWIVKIDAQNNKLWDKTFGGTDLERLRSVIAAPDGGYLLAGSSQSNASGDKSENSKGLLDYWIIRIDNKGNKLWDKTFGGNRHDLLLSGIAMPRGGYLLSGYSQSHAGGDKSEDNKGIMNYWVVRIDDQGNKIWDRTLGGNRQDEPRSATATSDGGCLLGGYSDSDLSGDKSENSKGSTDYWVIKLDDQGNKEWDKTLGGNSSDVLSSNVLTVDGGYLLAGYSLSEASGDKSENGKGGNDFWVVKIDATGNKVWDKTFGGNFSDLCASVVSAPDGGYLLAGYSTSRDSGDKSEDSKGMEDYWVLKIDDEGNKVWDRTIGGSYSDFLTSTILTPGGGYLLAGYSNSNASGDKSEDSKGDYDYWIAQLQETTTHPSLSILSFSLINEKTGAVIQEFMDSLTLDLATLSLKDLAIQAHTFPEQVGSVDFRFDNKTKHTDNVFPYIFTLPNNLKPGTYTVKADVYSEAHRKGEQGTGLTATVVVTNSLAVVSYDLVNTSGQVLRHLSEDDILYLDDLKANGQTIVANTTGQIGSVKLSINNKFFSLQNAFPYTLTGDNYGTYFEPWIPEAGSYTLTATPYSKSDAEGRAGQSITIHLTIKSIAVRAVVSYDIVNTSGKVLRRLNEGDILNVDDLKSKGQTIVANTTGQIGSVTFFVNKKFFNLQNAFPYTLTGDNYGNYFEPWIPEAGSYTLAATPYSKSDASGDDGRPLTLHFTVADDNNAASRMIATGTEENSSVGNDAADLTIYPVPVENELFVELGDTAGKDAMLSILTLQGVNVYKGTYSQSSSISTVDLKPGVYVLKVVGRNGFQRLVKFIKK